MYKDLYSVNSDSITFAYDIRTEPAKIFYMDPDKTVDENLLKEDGLQFDSFQAWYDWKISRRRA